MYSAYGQSTIASTDPTQFKYQIFSTVYEYGPTWEKRIDIQNELRSLTADQLAEGNKAIFNRALNPGTTPTTEELSMVSEQTVQKNKRSKLDQYERLYSLLNTDVTAAFISKFKKYFIQIVQPDAPKLY